MCEGEKVVSEKLMKTNTPNWNIKATFYRKKPDEPILVEVSTSLYSIENTPHHALLILRIMQY